MYEDATSVVRANGQDNKAFGVRVGVHQGTVLSAQLFVIVLEALSREFRIGLPMELLMITETEELLGEKIQKWKESME